MSTTYIWNSIKCIYNDILAYFASFIIKKGVKMHQKMHLNPHLIPLEYDINQPKKL